MSNGHPDSAINSEQSSSSIQNNKRLSISTQFHPTKNSSSSDRGYNQRSLQNSHSNSLNFNNQNQNMSISHNLTSEIAPAHKSVRRKSTVTGGIITSLGRRMSTFLHIKDEDEKDRDKDNRNNSITSKNSNSRKSSLGNLAMAPSKLSTFRHGTAGSDNNAQDESITSAAFLHSAAYKKNPSSPNLLQNSAKTEKELDKMKNKRSRERRGSIFDLGRKSKEDDDEKNHKDHNMLSNSVKIESMIDGFMGLTKVYLSEMNLRWLPDSFERLQTLETLALDQNRFKSIPKQVTRLKNLKCLYMNDNKVQEIPCHVRDLVNLRYLWVQKNRIPDLPYHLITLPSLRYLHAENNCIEVLPESICEAVEIRGLSLGGLKSDHRLIS